MVKHLQLSKDVALPLETITERLAVVGQSGSGKTYAAMRIAELMLDATAQIVVLDPMGVWWGLLSSADGGRSGYRVHVFGGEHAHVPIVAEAGGLVAEVIVEKQISAVIDVSHMTRSEQVQFAIAFAERFFKLQVKVKRAVHLFVEEAQTFMPQKLPPEGAGGDPRKNPAVMLNRMELLVRQGRSQGIGCTIITQAPQAVAKSCLNQAGTLLAMRTIGKHERKAISDWMADKATDDAQLALDQLLPKLATGEAWVASPNFLGLFKHTHVSKKATFDSSATPKFGVKLEPPKVLAAIDVEALQEAMKTVVEEVKKDDPGHLRRRILELERQLAAKPAAAPAPAKPIVERVPTPVLGRDVADRILKLDTTLRALLGKFPSEIGNAAPAPLPVARTVVQAPPPRLASGRPWPVPAAPAPAKSPLEYTKSNLGKGEVAVLTAIAQHVSGVTREQLSVLTGYKRSSRDTYLQRLSAAGYCVQGGDAGESLLATEAGVAALGDGFNPLPTGSALRDHWLARLPEGERRIFEVVIRAYPRRITRDELSQVTEYKRSSRDTYLQRLRSRQLIIDGRDGIAASETLFS